MEVQRLLIDDEQWQTGTVALASQKANPYLLVTVHDLLQGKLPKSHISTTESQTGLFTQDYRLVDEGVQTQFTNIPRLSEL